MILIKKIMEMLFPGPIFINKNKRYAKFSIGDWSYGHPRILSWNDGTKLTIGKFCSFSSNVIIILGGEHRFDWVTTYPFSVLFKGASSYKGHPKSKGDVQIGNDVWIGSNVLILSCVEIGDGAVIGAGSVVAKDVLPYEIVAGNPGRHVRYRFDQETIERLIEIAWWNWPTSKIEEAWPLLLSDDLSGFISKYST